MNEFPEADVLVARGKYSTLAGERRAVYKALRDDLEAIAGACQRAVRFTEDIQFSLEQAGLAKKRIDAVLVRLTEAELLTHHIDELKPLAWGQKEPVL